jgi:hypothetical protein
MQAAHAILFIGILIILLGCSSFDGPREEMAENVSVVAVSIPEVRIYRLRLHQVKGQTHVVGAMHFRWRRGAAWRGHLDISLKAPDGAIVAETQARPVREPVPSRAQIRDRRATFHANLERTAQSGMTVYVVFSLDPHVQME